MQGLAVVNLKNRLFSALMLFAIAAEAFAEGGTCPQGYYPINSPGVVGCAPIPGYGSGGSSGLPAAPGPQWKTQWISVAFGNNGFGAAVDMPSKRKAEKAALAQCRSMGGTGCHINITNYNQCIAVARGGNTAMSVGAPEQKTAEMRAIEGCTKDTKNSNCEIYYSACSYPVRIR
jgi:hypothetical protein